MARHRVVIVGNGFGGVKTALQLVDDPRFKVTLIASHKDFRNYPTLYLNATGARKMASSIDLKEIFSGKSIEIIYTHATAIDKKDRVISLENGQTVGYEAAVLALGVKTNYFHIEGLEEFSYSIKTLASAERLKEHIYDQLIVQKRPDLNYVVVGGGPTGIELAGALPGYIKHVAAINDVPHPTVHVDLVEALPRLLPRLPKDVSRRISKQLKKVGVKLYLGSAVQAQSADALIVNGKPIRSHTVIWTAGVMNHPFFTDQGFQIASNHKVRVDQYLQSDPGVYVIGDNADTPFSGMAQTALYDAKFVAANIQRLADKKDPKPYVARKPVFVFPAGPHWAAVVWGPLRVYGRVGWLLRSAADWIDFHDFEPWQRATRHWAATLSEDPNRPKS